jgi:hypothetical protein
VQWQQQRLTSYFMMLSTSICSTTSDYYSASDVDDDVDNDTMFVDDIDDDAYRTTNIRRLHTLNNRDSSCITLPYYQTKRIEQSLKLLQVNIDGCLFIFLSIGCFRLKFRLFVIIVLPTRSLFDLLHIFVIYRLLIIFNNRHSSVSFR